METTKLNQWKKHLQFKGKRESTINSYIKNIEEFYSYCKEVGGLVKEEEILKEIDNKAIDTYVEYLRKEKKAKASTTNQKIISLKTFFKYLIEKQDLELNMSINKIETIGTVIVEEETTQKEIISTEEAKRILKCSYEKGEREKNFDFNSARNRFLISLLLSNGCRIEEILSTKMEDLIPIEDGYVINMDMKKVKNHINKKAFIVGDVLKYYNEYKAEREKNEKYSNSEYLIISTTGNKMNRKNTNDMFLKLTKKANVEVHFTNHCCRHFCASVLLDKGNNEESIKKLLGWKQKGDKVFEKYTRHSVNDDKTLIKMVKSVLE